MTYNKVTVRNIVHLSCTLYVYMYMHVCGNMHVDTLPALHPEYERAKGVARYTIDPTLNELLGSYYIIIPAAVLCKNNHPSTIP